MTVIGLDDTDSRTRGMCSTYLAALVAEAAADTGASVDRRVLVRLNPAVEHKTRGNAALAVHTDLDAERAFGLAADLVEEYAVGGDPHASPGLVVADGAPDAVPDAVADFSRDAVREFHTLEDAIRLAEEADYRHAGWGAETADGSTGRGRIGALAAVGAWRAWGGAGPDGGDGSNGGGGGGGDVTYEFVSYREFERCGTPREVDVDSVFAAADAAYPDAWDTVDRGTGEAVCIPNAPGPVLHAIRGDDPETVRRVAAAIDSEPVERTALFSTNQGTDAHLADADLGDVRDGAGYRVTGEVVTAPETRRGGHVFLAIGDGEDRLDCVAFAPTERFRDRVRALRVGDCITACGEVGARGGTDAAEVGARGGTEAAEVGARSGDTDAAEVRRGALKLEKFAVRSLVETESVVPTCPDCGRSMESAGAGQGYRCRDCGTAAPGKVARDLERDLEPGWYEVPPTARRHVARPLVRGGFDAPTHPER